MPRHAHWIKTLYQSILLNRVRRGSRDGVSDVQRFVRDRAVNAVFALRLDLAFSKGVDIRQ